jgi:hypothetical protein
MSTPNDANFDVLGRALQKQTAGMGRTATEGRAIRDFEQGKIGRDHFAAITTPPVRLPSGPAPAGDGPKSKLLAIGNVDGLEAALRKIGYDAADSADLTALTARVVVLETLLSGLARRSVDVCDAGTAKTMTIVSTAPA